MKTISGLHLLLDGYVRDGKTLNPETICNLFDNLVAELGMQYLQPPTAVRVPLDPDKLQTGDDEGGWSVICQITTSHISLHGWPLRGAFMMDIFSCKDFNADRARVLVEEALGVTDCKVNVVRRTDPRASAA
ncbi:MAG: S-adenosylmethionine decarboxylase [Deltaproteobacteria bacterium]|nr:S-adenosylmethionine decarboxylase [Deltaproteobacteria bacterium]